jgi:hypothetical protein
MDVTTLAGLLREAEEHHGPYEAGAPKHHWWDWYAPYILARQDGRTAAEAEAEAGRHVQAVQS